MQTTEQWTAIANELLMLCLKNDIRVTVKDPPAHFPTRVKEVVAVIGLHYLQKIQDEEGTHVAIDDEPDFCIFLVGDTFHTRHLLPAGYVWSRVDDKINAWAIKFDGMLDSEGPRQTCTPNPAPLPPPRSLRIAHHAHSPMPQLIPTTR